MPDARKGSTGLKKPKTEARNPKEIRSPKPEIRTPATRSKSSSRRESALTSIEVPRKFEPAHTGCCQRRRFLTSGQTGLCRILNFFRISDFGLRICEFGLFRAIWIAKTLKTIDKSTHVNGC
jgi:hypothetical protein